MGRRAIPKIDPSLDYSSWLYEEEELPQQLPNDLLFGRAAPLEIEVGSGKGLFLARVTQTCPAHDFLGIEIGGKYARFAAAGLAKQQQANGKLVRGDAVRILSQRVQSDSLAAVHVYFPDPWWKTRHRKRRVMNESFVRDVQRVLQPGGVLHFWTDVLEYYETTLSLLDRATDLQGPEVPTAELAEHDLDYRTHFERRMRLNNLPIYRSHFRK
jgi:tRNA (guanine-N7-)-methyltransferase